MEVLLEHLENFVVLMMKLEEENIEKKTCWTNQHPDAQPHLEEELHPAVLQGRVTEHVLQMWFC